ncbi:unnamed protein product [Closterium sp. NIES-64]|nr:unnamed protein product [Closterium sp. NIES-64]
MFRPILHLYVVPPVPCAGTRELYYNNISGTIPAAIAHLPLTYMSLFSNMLSGTIPAFHPMRLSSLSVLFETMDLSYNHLLGSLPTGLCSITVSHRNSRAAAD